MIRSAALAPVMWEKIQKEEERLSVWHVVCTHLHIGLTYLSVLLEDFQEEFSPRT